jgi:hypothetical protein
MNVPTPSPAAASRPIAIGPPSKHHLLARAASS